MDEEKRFLNSATALVAAGIAAVALISVIIVMASLGGEEGDTDYGWKSPAMAFTDGTEMTGSAVTDSMKGFEGYEVGFIVTTKDGNTSVYNHDGEVFLPAYDRNTASTAAGYINPNGVFLISAKPDGDGRVRCVEITQK